MPAILSILDRYDFVNIKEAAPDDEYESEARMIARGLDRSAQPDDVAELIQAVFVEQFGERQDENAVRAAASEIWALRT